MTQIARTVIVAIEYRDDAIALSVVNGSPQFSFAAEAVEASAVNPSEATYCFSAGTVDEEIIALYEAEPQKYTISTSVGRQVQAALDAHIPALVRFFAPA